MSLIKCKEAKYLKALEGGRSRFTCKMSNLNSLKVILLISLEKILEDYNIEI